MSKLTGKGSLRCAYWRASAIRSLVQSLEINPVRTCGSTMANERLLLLRIKRLGGMGVVQSGFCYPFLSALCGVTCAALTKH